jgi:hypothetical protein
MCFNLQVDAEIFLWGSKIILTWLHFCIKHGPLLDRCYHSLATISGSWSHDQGAKAISGDFKLI